MKKLILLFVFILSSYCVAFAEKSYVLMIAKDVFWQSGMTPASEILLSGNIPSNMKSKYTYKDLPENLRKEKTAEYWLGYIINLLAKEGFEVEQQTVVEKNTISYLFSKSAETSSNKGENDKR